VLLAVLPMGLAPAWNGEKPAHRNQYEVAARAFLEGHFDLDYGDMDPQLLALGNPYSPAERKAAGVRYHWDHSFYNGKYYMYFGVVPVCLLFLPYLVITGNDLTTYHATQLFTAGFIIGFFALVLLLRKRFFPRVSYWLMTGVAAAVSLAAVWYASAAPALYCTAITAGLVMEIWSLYFFFKAVYATENENRAILRAGIGALFGALAFGCRPPVALANVLVIPLLIVFLREHRFRFSLLLKLFAAASPYLLIGGLLMAYNYVRFGSVTEFGQSYQLTITDVSKGLQLTAESLFKGLKYYLVATDGKKNLLSYGAFITFPVLALFILPVFRKGAFKGAKGLLAVWILLVLTPLAITVVDVAGSPLFLPRYRADFTWLFGLAAVFGAGLFTNRIENKTARTVVEAAIGLFALVAVVASIVLFFYPYDANFASTLASAK